MKSLIVENKDNQTKLKEFMKQIQSGIDPILAVAATTVAVSPALDQNSGSSQPSES